jgi:Ni,Fe-hydrogenase III small subunit/ferredoxin
VVTTRYPQRPDTYAVDFAGAVDVLDPMADPALAKCCPTGAIAVTHGRVSVDRGACILCGACLAAYPGTFAWARGSANARTRRGALIVPDPPIEDETSVAALRADLAARVRRLRRSVHLRHVDAGSDGSEEWEIQALTNPTYDVHRLGIFFTASPRHADLLLVTGSGARGMLEPLRRTRTGMPDPVVVIAVGTDAITGGLLADSYATVGGLTEQLDVDVWVPGSPPSPFAILHGILLALGRIPQPTPRGAS